MDADLHARKKHKVSGFLELKLLIMKASLFSVCFEKYQILKFNLHYIKLHKLLACEVQLLFWLTLLVASSHTGMVIIISV